MHTRLFNSFHVNKTVYSVIDMGEIKIQTHDKSIHPLFDLQTIYTDTHTCKSMHPYQFI